MSRPPRILLSAGEASGDRLAAGLAREILRLRPDAELFGMGGDEMAEAGVRLVTHASAVSVVGLLEVVTHLPSILRAMRAVTRAAEETPPDLVVPVDFPDFNLRLATRFASRGIPIVYYVSPQVWAWRRGRVRQIARVVRRVLALFPFEERFYAGEGVPVTFVGHPAAARSIDPGEGREAARAAGLDPDRPFLALLPGSRVGEVSRLLPIQLSALELLRRARPGLQGVVPGARTLPREWIEKLARGADVAVLSGGYPAILAAATVGIVASGTATLDCALAGLPSVVVYRMQPLTYLLARRLVRVDHIALPNLVAGRRLLPELVQDACRPERIAEEAGRLLDDPPVREGMRRALADIRGRLSGEGAWERAARGVLAELPPDLR